MDKLDDACAGFNIVDIKNSLNSLEHEDYCQLIAGIGKEHFRHFESPLHMIDDLFEAIIFAYEEGDNRVKFRSDSFHPVIVERVYRILRSNKIQISQGRRNDTLYWGSGNLA